MKLKAVRVDVLDVETRSGWWDYNRKQHDNEQSTIPVYGILGDRNDKWVVLANSYNKGAGEWLGGVSIPAGIVKRIRVVEVTDV